MDVGDEKHEEEAGILEDFDYHDNINAESYEKYFKNVCILEDFDYHDSINAESYEKYFKNVCKLLKPNSVIIIDNASKLSFQKHR